jgi:hypothetical protein
MFSEYTLSFPELSIKRGTFKYIWLCYGFQLPHWFSVYSYQYYNLYIWLCPGFLYTATSTAIFTFGCVLVFCIQLSVLQSFSSTAAAWASLLHLPAPCGLKPAAGSGFGDAESWEHNIYRPQVVFKSGLSQYIMSKRVFIVCLLVHAFPCMTWSAKNYLSHMAAWPPFSSTWPHAPSYLL